MTGVREQLLLSRRDPKDLHRSRRQFQPYTLARSPEQDRLQGFSQLPKILVAENLPFLVDNPVAIEKSEARAQPAVVDKLHDRIQVIQPVLQRRSRQNQGEPRTKAFDHATCLRLPILDPLPFVENDQIPRCALDHE